LDENEFENSKEGEVGLKIKKNMLPALLSYFIGFVVFRLL
jgi:hypothetical protein